MKMKTTKALGRLLAVSLSVVALGFGLSSCSKKESVQTTAIPQYSANPIKSTTLTGALKGTLLSSVGNYTVTGDIRVLKTDTLFIQKGVTVTVQVSSTSSPSFFVAGTIISEGTKDAPITFTSNTKLQGDWGGFQCDTAKYVRFNWTHINYTGGPNPDDDNKPRPTLIVDSPDSLIFHDSWIQSGSDDGIHASHGAKISILRNTIFGQGTTDGESINIKTGAQGDIAYNVIGFGAGTAIKVETNKDVVVPQTTVRVFNNTVVNNGYRRGVGEPGVGTSVDVSAQAVVFNNIYANAANGLNLTTKADTNYLKGKYGYNLFYATRTYADSNYYVPGAWGKKQSTDQYKVDPKFVSYSSNFNNADQGPAAGYDYHLQSGSPALGNGNPTYSNDIGAYTTDGKGNQH